MLMKTKKTNFGDVAPLIIMVHLFSIEAPPIEYELQGKGIYPYACQHTLDYPDAYIYMSESGGWVGSYDLELQEDGSYIIK